VVVIMFELTGALTYILPTMIVVGVTKSVSDRFGKGGIADRMIWFNGFPFLDNKEDHTFGVPVSHVMSKALTTLTTSGMEVAEVEELMNRSAVQGYPIVEDQDRNILVGYIGRTELRYALDRARREQMVPRHAKCFFSPENARLMPTTPSSAIPAVTFDNIAETAMQMSVDLSKFVDFAPITVHPRLPLETVMEVFKKLGPRSILVEYRGRLTGLVTVKDCLKYQFQVEAQENPKDDSAIKEGQDKLWSVMTKVASWLNGRLGRSARGHVRLDSDGGLVSRGPTDSNGSVQPRRTSRQDGLELEDRFDARDS